MLQDTQSRTEPPNEGRTPSFTLQELHLYNWGAFSGRHRVSIDTANTAIIGPTGSGKTTLVDALMTLLTAQPRYNLASTGGHESDRDLVSYVRGHSGTGHLGDNSDHIARPGRCVTAIAARMSRDADTVLLGGLFWFDGSSSSVTDMSRRWFFAEGREHQLDLWLEEHHSGGARALAQLEKNSDGLRIFASKSAYLSKLQSYFDVGPNAFVLLNRAAGLKQLNSIDEIFRELVLDDHSAFEEALDVARSFDELAAIHTELEVANQQYVSLLPLRRLHSEEQSQAKKRYDLQELGTSFPAWMAQQGVRLWQERAEQLLAAKGHQQSISDELSQQLLRAGETAESLHGIYLNAGGSNIDFLKLAIVSLRKELGTRKHALDDFHELLRDLQLDSAIALDPDALEALHQQARMALLQSDEQLQSLKAQHEQAVADERNAYAERQHIKDETDAVRRNPGSNLPSEFLQFRAELAEHLQLGTEHLPYVAELIEVPDKESAWRGAIERAIGSHRLRILVPHTVMRDALNWVNGRHNRLHVRLLDVREPSNTVTFWGDGFCRKLSFKPHVHLASIKEFLSQLDRHCVTTPERLQGTPHALTREGLMSGKSGQFDKLDQKRITEGWLTGFDNRDRLNELTLRLQHTRETWSGLNERKAAAERILQSAAKTQSQWKGLLAQRFEDLDTSEVDTRLGVHEEQLETLLNPASDAALAQVRWEEAKAHHQQLSAQLNEQRGQLGQTQALHKEAEKNLAAYQRRSGESRTSLVSLESIAERLSQTLPFALPAFDCEQLNDQERTILDALQKLTGTCVANHQDLQQDILKQLGRALKVDTGALAEQAEDIRALPHFLDRLRVLEEEDLPAKRLKFQEYLNKTSEQGVTRLLRGIDTQVADITERISELNQTLIRVDFQPGRYLQLDPQPVIHQSLQNLNKAMQHLRSERLRDDGGQSHYKALREMVDFLREQASNRRTKPSQALFDARYRLQFAVHVIDRDTGTVLERRTGSQGGSGGKKEIIASYVLTASLSYALCPQGRRRPVFGTIVLDEAFSKSSQAVAARIIQALREFGLHALFVTPNKELRLLRNYTRSAVVVHRLGRKATLTTLSWQELDAAYEQRKVSASA